MLKSVLFVLQSSLLYCDTGRHTGERVRDEFLKVAENYDIDTKITHVISDNASNMRKAFATHFHQMPEEVEEESDESDSDDVDNAELW